VILLCSRDRPYCWKSLKGKLIEVEQSRLQMRADGGVVARLQDRACR